ncbi:heavy-metal-associated domain-containing protein [Gossypium australe]|uniref:Heavy-metal-associated domain-containing protein n=1 Tax=Gossypium australe TaxID=47621 RepID=A0A5B6UTG8_9ROSI|nr:heavy-metal-associated domain-containing protein [Gossypium australe]
MATISAFSTPLHLISKTHFKSPKSLSFHPNSIHFQTKVSTFSSNNLTLSFKNSKTLYGTWKLKSAEEEETAVVEQEQEETTVAEQESVSVPVSPSDTLRMYFQADGMLNEAEIPKVTKALEGAEGVSDLKVQVLEGIGTVELTKQTTVQATGVASNLVELIQGAGFKLQTLNLSFDDEEDILV